MLMLRKGLDELIDLALGGVEVRACAEPSAANREDDAVLGLEVPLNLVVVVYV